MSKRKKPTNGKRVVAMTEGHPLSNLAFTMAAADAINRERDGQLTTVWTGKRRKRVGVVRGLRVETGADGIRRLVGTLVLDGDAPLVQPKPYTSIEVEP